MIPYFHALFIQRHGMISALMIYGPKKYIKYLTMRKVHMHAGAIRQLLYGCVYNVCTGDYPLAKDRGFSSRTYAQTINNIECLISRNII